MEQERRTYLNNDYAGKKITVVGLARSGLGAANLLKALGADVTITDRKSYDDVRNYLDKLDEGIRVVLGGHPEELFKDIDLIVISPGVPSDIKPIREAKKWGVKVIGELELAYKILRLTISESAEFLAITGTNGKSTTTTLLYEMLKDSGFGVILGGNIGNALTEEISSLIFLNSNFDRIVAEVSSFQLETIETFRPDVAAILNITPDHLDRYNSISDYIDAKCRIFMNQRDGDFLVLNADDPLKDEIIKRLRGRVSQYKFPQVFYFSRRDVVQGAYLRDGMVYFDLPCLDIPTEFNLKPSDFKIKGVHNIENVMAASLMAILSGCKPDSILSTITKFSGLEHRLEFVREINGVRFINDSKGTNVGAVLKSLESFDEPIVLIAGGRDKDSDFSVLRKIVKEKVKAMVLIGEAKEKIKKAVGDLLKDVYMEEDIKSAVLRARELASFGDVVLLSPACASFDMFRDFEDRGRQFKRAVMEL